MGIVHLCYPARNGVSSCYAGQTSGAGTEMGKEWKIKLINEFNPAWEDLYNER